MIWIIPIFLMWVAIGTWVIRLSCGGVSLLQARLMYPPGISDWEVLDKPNSELARKFFFWATLWPWYLYRRYTRLD